VRRLSLLLGPVLVAGLVFPAVAAKPAHAGGGLTFTPSGFSERQSPVEQASDWPWLPSLTDCSAGARCTVNPTACSWDVDDHWQLWVQGVLAPGASVTHVSCLIAPQNPVWLSVNGSEGWYGWPLNRFYVDLSASSSDLLITVTFDPGPTFVATVADGTYRLCGGKHYPPGDPALVPIAGSGRGTNGQDALGVPTTVTLTIANPSSRRVHNITGFVGMTGTAPCP